MTENTPSCWTLEVTDGPSAGEVRSLAEGSLLVCGRAPDVGLSVADHHVSSRHFQLSIVDGVVRLTDLGSSNGTFVGGRAVTEAELADGDVVVIGASACTIRDRRQSGRRIENATIVGPPPLDVGPPPLEQPPVSSPPEQPPPIVMPPQAPAPQPPPVPPPIDAAQEDITSSPGPSPDAGDSRPSRGLATVRLGTWVRIAAAILVLGMATSIWATWSLLLGGSGEWSLLPSVVRSAISNGWSGRLRPQAQVTHNTPAIDLRPDPALRITAPRGAVDIEREFRVQRLDPDRVPVADGFDSLRMAVPLAAFEIDASMDDDDLFIEPVRFAFDLEELNIPRAQWAQVGLLHVDEDGRQRSLVTVLERGTMATEIRHNGIILIVGLPAIPLTLGVLAGVDHISKWGYTEAMFGGELNVVATPRFRIWFPKRALPWRDTPEYGEVQATLKERWQYYIDEMQTLQQPGAPALTLSDRKRLYAADERVQAATALLADDSFLRAYVLPNQIILVLDALARAEQYLWTHRGFLKPSEQVDIILPEKYTGSATSFGFQRDGHFAYPYIHLNLSKIPREAPGPPNPAVLDELDTTVLHELFHVVQKEYFNWSKYLSPTHVWGGQRYAWFLEATALVLEEDAEPYYHRQGWTRTAFGKTFIASAHMGWFKLPLDAAAATEPETQDKGYGASRFLLSLRDRYYASNPDAFLKNYLWRFHSVKSPVGVLAFITSKSGLVLGADYQIFAVRHADAISLAAPKPVKRTLTRARPVAKWPLEAAPLSSAMCEFDYRSLDAKELDAALLVVRTEVNAEVRVGTRTRSGASAPWKTIDDSLPVVSATAAKKSQQALMVQRIDASAGEWWERPIASWFSDAKTTVVLLAKPITPPKLELLPDAGTVRVEFPLSPLEEAGELIRREARIAFGGGKEVTIAFTEGRSGDVIWRQIARDQSMRALAQMKDPRVRKLFLPQDIEDMLAIWSAFRGILGGDDLNLEIRYREVVRHRPSDGPEDTGIDGPWSEVFKVPIETPLPSGHPGDISGSWAGQIMLFHGPIFMELTMAGLDIDGTMIMEGEILRIEGVWIQDEAAWEVTMLSTDPDDPGVSFIQPYLRALPDGSLWLPAPPAVLRRPQPAEEDKPKPGFWQRIFGG
jgi:FHA domain